ncbi:MAG TPA: hypothetical protein VKE74_01670 [Gemmataceae bacterium]|nr:hypothetical protein [Gemmataceae bacterium]
MSTLFDSLVDDNPGPREGDLLRDRALGLLRAHRPHLLRRLQRAFLQHLLDHGEDTSDALRCLVEIPRDIDPRIVGSAVRSLAELRLIVSVGRRKSRRGIAHSRKLDLWAIRDGANARHWLATHPDLDPSADHTGPALV